MKLKLKKKKTGEERVKIIPLGGLEQIGMNITAFETEESIIVVDCGTFVGVYLALSLFAAIHKPPMPVPMPMPAPCPCQQMMFRPDFGPQHFYRGHRGDFHKKMMKHRMENNAPRPVQEADD